MLKLLLFSLFLVLDLPSDLVMSTLFCPLIGLSLKAQESYLTRVFDSIPTANYIGDLYPCVFQKPHTLFTTSLLIHSFNNYYFAPILWIGGIVTPSRKESLMLLTLPNRPIVNVDTPILFIQAWVIARENKYKSYLAAEQLGLIPENIMFLLRKFLDPAILANKALKEKLEPCVSIYLELEQKLSVLNRLIYFFGLNDNPHTQIHEDYPKLHNIDDWKIIRMKDFIVDNFGDLKETDNYRRCLDDLIQRRVHFSAWNFKASLSTCRKHLVNISRLVVQTKAKEFFANLHVEDLYELLVEQINHIKNVNPDLTPNQITELCQSFNIVVQLYQNTVADAKKKRLKLPDYARVRVAYKRQFGEIKELLESNVQVGYFYLFNTLKRHEDLPTAHPTKTPFTEEIKNLRITHYTANQFLYTILKALCENSSGDNQNFILEFLYNFDHAYVDLRQYETQISAGVPNNTIKAFHLSNQEECNLHLQAIEYIHFISLYQLFSVFNLTRTLNPKNAYNIGLSMATLITEISGNFRYQIFTKPGDIDYNSFLFTTDETQKTQIRLASFDWHKTPTGEIYTIITRVLGYRNIESFRNAIIHLLNEIDKRFYLELLLHFHYRENNLHAI